MHLVRQLLFRILMLGGITALSGGIGVVHQLVHFHTEIDALSDTCGTAEGCTVDGHYTVHVHGDHHHSGCGEQHCTGAGCSATGSVVKVQFSQVSHQPLPQFNSSCMPFTVPVMPQKIFISPNSGGNRKISVLRI